MRALSNRITNIDKLAVPWFVVGVIVALIVPTDVLDTVPEIRSIAQYIEYIAPKLARVSAVSKFPAVTTTFFTVMAMLLPLQVLHLYVYRDETYAFLQPIRQPYLFLVGALSFAVLIGFWLGYSPGPVMEDLEPAVRGNYLALFSQSRLSLGLVGTALLFLFSISISLTLMCIQSIVKGRHKS